MKKEKEKTNIIWYKKKTIQHQKVYNKTTIKTNKIIKKF